MDSLPSKDALRAFIAENPGQTAKRDIARAFGIKGSAARIELKRLLRDLQAEGALTRTRGGWKDPEALPPVTVLEVTGPDAQGDLYARALEWSGEGAEPRLLVIPSKGDPALGAGDRVLARIAPVEGQDHSHEARPIRRLQAPAARMLGIFRETREGGRVVPIVRGETTEWRVPAGATMGARDGELVEAEPQGPRRLGAPQARVVARLGDPSAPRAVSLIAIHQHRIPTRFPDAALAEAEAAAEPGPGGRTDWRDKPFVTIDPPDARDRDDAVQAEPDPAPDNPGGWLLRVAIADVAAFVRPGSALDAEARLRGNSTYFPDRVVPMLPDRLSGDLCSLHQGVDRAVLGVTLRLTAQGDKLSHTFARAVIRPRASLTYAQAQAFADGDATAVPAEAAAALPPLWAAHAAAAAARDRRQPLDLDLPERQIVLDDAGHVASVAFKERLAAHRLIEDFMVLANVAAAEELIRRRTPLLFRVHEEPEPEKLEALREVAEASGFTLAKGQVLKTAHLNRLLAQAAGTDQAELLNITTLRSLPQAYYHPENFGHFGLALRAYAHFTSPIRRYADLIVHRALIAAHGFGAGGLSPLDTERIEETGTAISEAERRSMAAERDTTDRYLAAFLADRVGQSFGGRVSGVQRFGLFVRLDGSGADGLVPIRAVGREFFHHDPEAQTLVGSDSGMTIGLGARVTVRLAEAVPATGGLLLDLIEVEGGALPAPARRKPGKPLARKPGQAAARARKVVRRRK
jgi:ribonuclease R